MIKSTSTAICYHCGSAKTVKGGFSRGKRRYFCKTCGRSFRENPAILRSGKRYRQTTARKGPVPSRSSMILHLRAIADKIGRTPTTNDIVELSKRKRSYPLNVYYVVFGSYVEAVKQSRLEQHYQREIDTERLLFQVRALRQKLGRALIYSDIVAAARRKEVAPTSQFLKGFGTLPAAIKAAGAHRRWYSASEIKDYLKLLAAELGRVPTGNDIRARWIAGETPSLKEVLKMFGTLDKARRAARIFYKLGGGRNTHYWRRYTPEELLDQMRRLKAELGRNPNDRDLNRASKAGKTASSTTFRHYFGGLSNAYAKL